ncbi:MULTISPECIES: hypothetical protein [unclassified Brevundimonas]|uniref:TipJ family phage tail tip protein n=1 Tax=unclassified Brevundimonas TaxID=2622653 RepID=UPI0025C45AD1|nr:MULTISPECIES: hypothetical protein [unclassified Brevundimonas]
MADGSVPIVLSPEPFARTTTYVEAPAGCTVRTMLASAVSRGHLKLDDLARTNVYVDGVRLDREDALTMVLHEGQVINVVVEPLGGGSGGKKEIGQILLTIAVIAVSMWVGGPAGPLQAWPMLARQVAAAAILTAGQMAVAAIFKPETNVTKTNDRYALSSASNQYRQWGAMPLALGEVVVAPDLAVKTFTQAHGEDQWIYGILGLHYGPCTATDLKIGDTLVSSMGANDVRVAYHLTPGPRTFSIVANDTDQLDLQEELAATVSGATPVVRAGSAEGERFEFDFFMPQGLYFAKDDGRKIAASVTVTIRYRPIDQNGVPTGGGAWQSGLTVPLTSASSDPWRFTQSISLPLGRYEFEVVRSRLEDTNAKRKTDIGWTAIRAIAFRKPVADETLSLIEFAVRASALNQGSLAPLTCCIIPICETWTGNAWGAPVPTSNPAAVTRWLMTGPAPALPLSSAQADVGLRTWAALCDQYDWKAHLYLTEDRKQDAVLQLLGMNGRASLFWDGTQLVASPWTEKPAPRQLFAGSNLKDHRWEIVFPDPVHALRVEFQNIEQGGEADEVYVYADGYGETADAANGIEAATLVEALRLEGQQTLERAYRDGRWNLAARIHQRRVDSWSTDIEHIVCRFGDRVRLAWDRVGTANATVRNRIWSGGLVSGLRLSQPVRMEPGRTYALDIRLPGQVLTGVPVVNPATSMPVVTRTISFVDLRNANVSPRGGDLIAFGEPERISEDVEVIGITPGPDLTATLVGIRYVAPLLMAAETGPIPPLKSRLTRERAMDPPMPTLLGWQADAEGVRIGFSMPPWRGSPVTGFTLRWRQTPGAGQSAAWVSLPDLPANAMTAVLPPLRELPAEATNATSAQVQIVVMTADGRASAPLQVTVSEQAIQQPPAGDWTVAELTEGPDGSRQSGFLVIGLVGSINPHRVTVEYGASATGPWDAAFDGPPVNGVVRAPILGMQPGGHCWIGITYWTPQGVAPSGRRILGPYTAPGLIAGDLSPESPVRIAVTEITDRLVGVEGISAANAAAVADLQEVYGDTASSAQNAAVAAEKASQAILAQAGAVTAEQGALSAKSDSVAAAGASASSASQAGGFKTAAEAASAAATEQKLQAQAARDEAGANAAASAQSAANASASETQAGLQAAASQSAKNAAEAARGQAETYRNETATARDTAQGAAAMATAQAGLSASSAGASQAAANSPLATSPALSPDAFLVNSWATLNGQPNLRQVFADNPGKIYPINSTVEVNNFGVGVHLNTAKAVARPEGHRFRYSARIRRMAEGGDASQNRVTLYAWFWNADGVEIGGAELMDVNPGTAQGTRLLSAEYLPPSGTAWTRTMLRIWSMVGVTAALSIETEDVEAEKTATAAAAASVASAGMASTKADEAGVSAAAANAAKVAAEVARDGSSGSAAASATSASQALAYRNQAGEFASSSSGSANAAGTAAGQAQAYRDQSASSAATANAASVSSGVSATTAQRAAESTLPSTFEENGRYFGTVTGPGLALGDINYQVFFPTIAGIGKVVNRDGFAEYGTKGVIALKPGRKHRVRSRGRIVQNGPNDTHQWVLGFQIYDANGTILNQWWTEFSNIKRHADGWYDIGGSEPTTEQLQAHAPGATYIRPYVLQGWGASVYPGSISEVAFLRYEDVTESAAAANSAAAALSSQAGADAAASRASISANLAASVGANASVVNNSRFLNWPAGQPRPAGWDDWANANGTPNLGPVDGWNGRRPVRMQYVSSMQDLGMKQVISGFRGAGAYNLEVEIAIPWGGPTGTGFQGAGVLIQCMDANFNYLGDGGVLRFFQDPDTGGYVAGSGSGDGKIYRFSKRVDLLPNTASVQLYLMSRWKDGFLPQGANENKTLDWYSCDLSPVTEGDRAVPALAAQLNVTAAVAADAQSRLASVIFEIIGASGGDPFQLLFRTIGSSSYGRLVASALEFCNVVGGQVVTAMKLIGGEVFFMRPIYVDVGQARLIVGPGNGWVLWFGPSSNSAAQATRTNGVFCMGTDGKVYYGTAELGGASKANGVKRFASSAGGSAAISTPFENTQAGSLITCTGSIDGGSLTTANATVYGSVSIYEQTSGAERLLFSRPIEMSSGELQLPNGSYAIETGGSWSGQQFGELSGSVSYRVAFTRSGPNQFVNGATISAAVVVTPAA